MKAINGFRAIKEASGDFDKLPAGGYVCRILRVQDVPEKEYIRVDFDITDGIYAKYFEDWYDRNGKKWWPGYFNRSYKDSSLGFFKSFLMCVDETNGTNFTEQAETGFNEQQLVKKQIGLVIGYEEYKGSDNKIKQRIRIASTKTVAQIEDGKYTVPALKTLGNAPVSAAVPDITFSSIESSDYDLPF